jgi:hypothetical protein
MGVFSDEKAFKDFNPVMVDILDNKKEASHKS